MHNSPLCVIPGEYVWPMAKPYWPFQPAVSTSHSYGKMVPPTTPYGKNIPPRLLELGTVVGGECCGVLWSFAALLDTSSPR